MSVIKLMSKELAEKIAAGEVVERPASIVKELVENSIDAGSTAVTVEIREGGLDFIRVTDNGCGILPEDMKMAFARHATSKLYTESDLYELKQLGFRGEALASIAAVSKIHMNSCVPGSVYGAEIILEGGEIIRFNETGCPAGTSIIAEELFYNTPARRKFLKKPSQEAAYIGDILTRLILARPGVSFKYINDGKTVLHSPGDGSLANAIQAVYGRETVDHMLPVLFEEEKVRIEGYISDIELEKSNRTYQTLFINGRYIKDSDLSQSVQDGYINSIGTGKFPMYVLNVTVPASLADVNVHPNKLEVRFAPELNIHDCMLRAVRGALGESFKVPHILEEPAAQSEEPQAKVIREEEPSAPVMGEEISELNEEAKENSGKEELPRVIIPIVSKPGKFAENFRAVTGFEPRKMPVSLRPVKELEQLALEADFPEGDYKLVGQMFLTYIVLEANNTAYIVDQHAAHERLLYERLKKQVDESAVISQQLLVPQILNLNYAEARKFESLSKYFEELGFEIEEFGSLSYAVRAVPVLLGKPNSSELILSMLDGTELVKSPKASDILREKLMQTACKHAIKGGDRLNDEEIKQLMVLIRSEEVPLSCPHGRPILIKLTKRELENKFKRNE
ncbi:MAG: DNA mismatch repair endonuclease MutL [Clostridiales bacterium]|jgi:DNA mismatch repair protein mutL|nr:DNA mismatch repair endonuclease MutL [Clostridiales bacterium]